MISPSPRNLQTMKSESFNPPFTNIAPYYDTIMSFVNYPGWVSYIETILLTNNVEAKQILDMACGTGTCLKLWLEKGYQVIGLDRSFTMLEICKKKISHYNNNLGLINCDMRNVSLKSPVPIITCLYDSLNYLLSEGDLLSCFHNVYNNLTPQGIFIFDMNTIHSLCDEWGNNTFHRKDKNIFSTWQNIYDRKTNISTLKLTLKIKENTKAVMLRECHKERAYPLTVIRNLLDNAGFSFSLYRHLTFRPADENDLRIMGVARK